MQTLYCGRPSWQSLMANLYLLISIQLFQFSLPVASTRQVYFLFFFFFFFFSFFDDDWFYSNWEHTNSKEILAIYLEVCRWSSYWQNRRIYIQSNNMTTKTTIHRVTSGNPFLMACLRHLFWLSEGTVKCIRPCIQSVTFSASLNVAMQQTTCSDLSIEILFFTYPIPGMFYYLGL